MNYYQLYILATEDYPGNQEIVPDIEEYILSHFHTIQISIPGNNTKPGNRIFKKKHRYKQEKQTRLISRVEELKGETSQCLS